MSVRSRHPLSFAGTVACLALSLAGCDSNAPTAAPVNDVAAAAFALDQQATRSTGSGDPESAAAFQSAAIALRYGARPTDIEVTVDGETKRYQALVTAVVETLAARDTALRRTLVAWNGQDRPLALLKVSTLGDQGSFASEFEPASNPRSRAQGRWVDFVRDSRWIATTGDAAIAVVSIGNNCHVVDRVAAGLRCVLADFRVDVDGLFRLHGASPEAGLPAVRIQTQAGRVNGIILGTAIANRGR